LPAHSFWQKIQFRQHYSLTRHWIAPKKLIILFAKKNREPMFMKSTPGLSQDEEDEIILDEKAKLEDVKKVKGNFYCSL